jgi:hypothetical protein
MAVTLAGSDELLKPSVACSHGEGTTKAKALCRFSRQQCLKPGIDQDLPSGSTRHSQQQGNDFRVKLLRICQMAIYTITLDSGETFACSDDTYILDAAEDQGFALLCVSYP